MKAYKQGKDWVVEHEGACCVGASLKEALAATLKCIDDRKYAYGKRDGEASRKMNNPIHANWTDANGVIQHYNPSYVLGYVTGYGL